MGDTAPSVGSRFWLLAALCFACPPTASSAQARKLDPRLQLISGEAGPPALGTAGAQAAAPKIRVLLRLRAGSSREDFAARYPAARFGAQTGRVVTAELPADMLESIEADPELDYAEASTLFRPALDVVRSTKTSGGIVLGTIDPAFPNFGTNTGAGVVVGIVDTGVDWSHLDFRLDSDPTKSRILFLWDQTDSGGPAPGGNFTYGTQWIKANIDDELDGSPPGTVREVDADGHGTHVTGIAAGDGSSTDGTHPAGTNKGMAPEADIVMVKTTFQGSDILDGVNYIIERAASQGKRAVINLSLSGQDGPHDGTTNFESSLNTIAASTPIAIAMGNDQFNNAHGQKVFGVNESATFTFQRFGAASLLTIDFWAPSGDAYSITVTATGQSGSVTAGAGSNASGTLGTNTAVSLSNGTNSHPSGDKQTFISITRSGGGNIVPSDFQFAFTRTVNGASGLLDGWVFDTNVAQFTNNVVLTGTLGSPAVIANGISVGSYCSKFTWQANGGGTTNDSGCASGTLGDISNFSGRGPTRDGRTKPDLTAPGHRVASALSTNGISDPESPGNVHQTGRHRHIKGTSMASPVVAGIVALKLQNDGSLTPAQIKSNLNSQVRIDSKVTAAGARPNDIWGYGKVSALGCGNVVIDTPTVPVSDVHGVSSITWTWGLVPNATSYHVYYATAPSTLIANPVSASLTLGTLLANTTYGIKVHGASPCGEGPGETAASTSTLASPVSAAGLATHVSSITVTFTPLPASPRSASSFGYRFEANTQANFLGEMFSSATAQVSAAQLTVTGLTGLTSYYLRLATLNETNGINPIHFGVRFTSTSLVAPATAPFTSVTGNDLTANWLLGDNPAGLQYFARLSTAADLSGTVLSNNTFNLSAGFSGLQLNTTYYFRVQAATGPPSAVVSTPTLATTALPLSAPFSSVFLTSGTAQWNGAGNPSGTKFLAEASADPNFGAVLISSLTANASLLLTGLDRNTTVYLRVAAVNHSGLKTAAIELATATLTDPPGQAADPFAGVTSSITVAWVPLPSSPQAASCEGYRLEASTAANFSGQLLFSRTANPAASKLGLQGLTAETTYYLRVGALNWNNVGHFILLGSTKTNTAVLSSQPVTNAGTIRLAVSPPFTQLSYIEVTVPPNTLPSGANLTVNASVPFTFDPSQANSGSMRPLADNAGVDISAEGFQPARPVAIRMDYDPAAIPAGFRPEHLVIANQQEGVWVLLPTALDIPARVLRTETRHFSLFAPFLVSANAQLSNVNVFPVPWKPGTGDPNYDAERLSFTNLPSDGRVELLTLQGEFVWGESANASGLVFWNGTNRSGHRVASGTYLAVISGAGGRTVRRVVVIR